MCECQIENTPLTESCGDPQCPNAPLVLSRHNAMGPEEESLCTEDAYIEIRFDRIDESQRLVESVLDSVTGYLVGRNGQDSLCERVVKNVNELILDHKAHFNNVLEDIESETTKTLDNIVQMLEHMHQHISTVEGQLKSMRIIVEANNGAIERVSKKVRDVRENTRSYNGSPRPEGFYRQPGDPGYYDGFIDNTI